jgi:hypothetical protein
MILLTEWNWYFSDYSHFIKYVLHWNSRVSLNRCGSRIFKIESRNKIRDLYVNFSFFNLENVLIIAFALHIGVMSDEIVIVYA